MAEFHRPLTDEHVRRHVENAGPRGVLARGLGRSYGDAAQNAGGAVLDLTPLDAVHDADLETGVVRIGAGASIGDLIRWFLPYGWFPPVVPGTQHVTVGGAIASDIHGKNHHAAGSWSHHVRALSLATPTGTLRLGPSEGSDLFWATMGGMGLTGVVLDATLQLLPVQTDAVRVEETRTSDLDRTLERLAQVDRDHTYSVAWVDCSALSRRGRAVVTCGEHATRDEAGPPERDPDDDGPLFSLPSWWSWRALSPAVLKTFNEAWYRRAPVAPRTEVVPFRSYFFPLDGVGAWNRLYGRQGFLQYQFVVPFQREDVLRRIIEDATSEATVFLAVLKRFGDASPGPLSFPTPGWTLALDIPVGSPRLADLLDRWDELVAAADGRVYLAKDARMRGELFGEMYPQLPKWHHAREQVDPERRMCSDLARRLGLACGHPHLDAERRSS